MECWIKGSSESFHDGQNKCTQSLNISHMGAKTVEVHFEILDIS